MTKQADLISYLFEDQQHLLSSDLMQWMKASSRFTAFVEIYRDKIRKKIRVLREPESMLDLRAELAVAFRLLNDHRLTVAYEPFASAKGRSPDFSVTYRANLTFNIEVTHLRMEEMDHLDEEERVRKEERIFRILLDKLGQMQPGMANLLIIQTREELVQSIDLERLMQMVKARVEAKDAAFYAASRYSGTAAFYKDFLHLGGILLCDRDVQAWTNKQARPRLDQKVLRVVTQALQEPLETDGE